MRYNRFTLQLLAGLFLISACSYNQPPNQELASQVDIDRFMGTWYVHGYTPTVIDKNAWNATESYQRLTNGDIQTTYSFSKGSADGKTKTYQPIGSIVDTETNALWKMRFFGIITAAYYVVYVDPSYEFTVIGHPNKKYAWIMSRSSSIDEKRYSLLRAELAKRDYDLSHFKRVPHG